MFNSGSKKKRNEIQEKMEVGMEEKDGLIINQKRM